MYLWRKRATAQWWRAHQSAFESQFGQKLALIAQPISKRLEIQIALSSVGELGELLRSAGGRTERLPRDWIKHFQHQHKPKPIRLKERQLIIPADAAFGTGEHATTAMCLQLLGHAMRVWGRHALRVSAIAPSRSRTFGEDFSPRPPNGTRGRMHSPELVADLGTGSGILALAARLLGAKRVIAIDNDPVAIRIAKENAGRNKIDNVEFRLADVRRLKLPRRVGIVTANLSSKLLIAVLPKVEQVPWLIFSGVLRKQERELTRALKRWKIDSVDVRRRGKWIAVLATSAGRSCRRKVGG
jgi:ribosomal protein L11 methylase PrmA